MYKTFVLFACFSLLVVSCSTFAPAPTSTPTQTSTPLPTETPVPTSTFTPEPPTATADVVAAMLPSNTPDKEWNGIPIMPEAINGEGDAQGYTFTIKTDAESIKQYYEAELAKLGFGLFATGDGTEKGTTLLMFMKEIEIVSISIIPHEDLMLVVLVK